MLNLVAMPVPGAQALQEICGIVGDGQLSRCKHSQDLVAMWRSPQGAIRAEKQVPCGSLLVDAQRGAHPPMLTKDRDDPRNCAFLGDLRESTPKLAHWLRTGVTALKINVVVVFPGGQGGEYSGWIELGFLYDAKHECRLVPSECAVFVRVHEVDPRRDGSQSRVDVLSSKRRCDPNKASQIESDPGEQRQCLAAIRCGYNHLLVASSRRRFTHRAVMRLERSLESCAEYFNRLPRPLGGPLSEPFLEQRNIGQLQCGSKLLLREHDRILEELQVVDEPVPSPEVVAQAQKQLGCVRPSAALHMLLDQSFDLGPQSVATGVVPVEEAGSKCMNPQLPE
jgi:hypothetical protein